MPNGAGRAGTAENPALCCAEGLIFLTVSVLAVYNVDGVADGSLFSLQGGILPQGKRHIFIRMPAVGDEKETAAEYLTDKKMQVKNDDDNLLRYL